MGQIVKAEAALPARVAASATPAGESPSQYLTFALGGEMFAVGILNVKEIIEYGHLTEISDDAPLYRGVINLRGSVVPSSIFRRASAARRPSLRAVRVSVVVEVSDGEARHDIGIMVDAVSEVLDIPPADIEPPPPSFGAKIRADFIFGMGKVAGKFVILLNIHRVLSVDEIAQLSLNEPSQSTADAGSP